MPNETLRVYAKGDAQVPNYEALAGGINARITHVCLPIGPQFTDAESGTVKRHAAFVKHVGKVITVPDRGEYRRHLRDKDLYPADKETAAKCGVKFDPDFGGEHHAEAVAEHVAALKELAGKDETLLAHIARVMPAPVEPKPTTGSNEEHEEHV